ncbi:undecaprenyl-diphosphate phosphatase [Flavobacteriaceae bacterium]|nr:undecaprenyl-diphosphate phosphatase [Flavobacteriaceae bacterium]
MADWTHVIFLALIQGLSEFLPISSSAHLVLPSQILGWPDQGLLFDVAVHVGTLSAVVAYYWRDLLAVAGDIFPPLRSTRYRQGELLCLIVASLPAVLAGLLLGSVIETYFRGLGVITATTLLFGVLLGWAVYRQRSDALPHAVRQSVSLRHAFFIGCAQMFALIPGVSRSGVTITAAILLGYKPATAARFSFLMSVPIIAGAMLFMALKVGAEGLGVVSLAQVSVAVVVAAVSAYATIALFIKLLDRVGLMPFVWYRMALGLTLLLLIMIPEA